MANYLSKFHPVLYMKRAFFVFCILILLLSLVSSVSAFSWSSFLKITGSAVADESAAIKCNKDYECKSPQYWCEESNACQEFYKCLDPGTENAKCSTTSTKECVECKQGCKNGQCQIITCSQDSDCGAAKSKNYCKDSQLCIYNVVPSCQNAATTESVCILKNTEVCTPCQYGCKDNLCLKEAPVTTPPPVTQVPSQLPTPAISVPAQQPPAQTAPVQESSIGYIHIEVVENVCEPCPNTKGTSCRCNSIKLTNAKVSLYDSAGKIINTGDTSQGYIEFYNLNFGKYIVALYAEGYNPDKIGFDVGANFGNYATVALKKVVTSTSTQQQTAETQPAPQPKIAPITPQVDTSQQMKEQVKCVFMESKKEQKCYLSEYNDKFFCSGTETCTMDVSGYKGQQLTWKSTCGGYAYTTVDGNNDDATFKCVSEEAVTPEQVKGRGFDKAYWQCYDGKDNFADSVEGVTCNSAEFWQKFANFICKNKCITKEADKEKCISGKEEYCHGYTKCGVNSFSVSQECYLEEKSGQVVVVPPIAVPVSTTPVPAQTEQQEVKQQEEVVMCKDSCPLNNKCYSFGYRKSGKYCSDTGAFQDQFKEEEKCDNNFECISNVCVNSKCISSGQIQKILDWFKRLFGAD